MTIRIKIFPSSKKEGVSELADGRLEVRVKAKAERGLANRAAIEALSCYFKAPVGKIRIISGHKGRNKTICIDN